MSVQQSGDEGEEDHQPEEGHRQDLEDLVEVLVDGGLGHAGVEGESEEDSEGQAEEVDESCAGEADDHEEGDDGHEEDAVEVGGVDLAEVVAVKEEGGCLDADAGAEDAAEAEQLSAHGDDSHAVGGEPGEEGERDGPDPAVLQLVHDEDAEDDVHDDVPVAEVHEHRGDHLVEVLPVRLHFPHVQQPVVQLLRVLQELLVPSWRVRDPRAHEDDEADSDEEGGEGGEDEVGADAVPEQVAEGLVGLLHFPGVYVGDAHAHDMLLIVMDEWVHTD